MLINYKPTTVNDIKDKTLYCIRVELDDGRELEMSSSGLIDVDTGCTSGNFLHEVLVFETEDEAIKYAQYAVKEYLHKLPISFAQVIPMKFNPEYFEGEMTDPIETLDELNFELDVENARTLA